PVCLAKREGPPSLLPQRRRGSLRTKGSPSRSSTGAKTGGGHGRNRTGVHGFAVRCVTTPPRGRPKARPACQQAARFPRVQAYIGADAYRQRRRLACLLPRLAAQKPRILLLLPRIMMTDFAAARRHMVDGQVRTTDVTDLRVISALLEVPRERFMPPASASLAYLDLDVPVGASRRLLKPMVLEQAAGLVKAAREALSSQPNVDVVNGALAEGWPQGAPYDVVVLEGATEAVPHAL